jgi:hypothetical protein
VLLEGQLTDGPKRCNPAAPGSNADAAGPFIDNSSQLQTQCSSPEMRCAIDGHGGPIVRREKGTRRNLLCVQHHVELAAERQ